MDIFIIVIVGAVIYSVALYGILILICRKEGIEIDLLKKDEE